jgi:transcriptional regulator with XRE-family HTH domain
MAPAPTCCPKEICAILGISRSTLSKLRREGRFPKPIIESPLRWARVQIDGLLLPGSQGSSPTSSSFSSRTTHSQDSRPAAGA